MDQLRKLHDDDWETFNSKVDLLAEEGMEVDRQHQKRLYADQVRMFDVFRYSCIVLYMSLS